MSRGLIGEGRAARLRAFSELPEFLTAAARRRFVPDTFWPFAYFSQSDANQLQDVNWYGKPRVAADELLRVLEGHAAGPGAVAVLAAAVLPKVREDPELPPMRDYRGEQPRRFSIGAEIGRGGQAVVQPQTERHPRERAASRRKFMAPEVSRDSYLEAPVAPATARADEYSPGLILSAPLTGKYSFAVDWEARKASPARVDTDCWRAELGGRIAPFIGANATGARGGRNV